MYTMKRCQTDVEVAIVVLMPALLVQSSLMKISMPNDVLSYQLIENRGELTDEAKSHMVIRYMAVIDAKLHVLGIALQHLIQNQLSNLSLSFSA